MFRIRIIVCGSILLFINAACVQTQISTTAKIATASPTLSSPETVVLTETPTNTPTSKPTETPTTPPTVTSSTRLLWVSSSADLFNRLISVDPGNPQRIAYCAPNQIRLSLDGGQTWEDSIPTEGISAVAQENKYTIFDASPACLSVTLDPNLPESFYTVYTTAQEEYGAPPLFYMGFFTTDNGSTWQLVPPPFPATIEDFGGFWNLNGEKVEAMFMRPGQTSDPTENILIQQTANGGSSWQPGDLACPKIGPCVRWGPAASNIPGMGSPLPQSIIVSTDEGQTWSAVDPQIELRAPSPNQLVAFTEREIAILSGGITLSSEPETPPLQFSEDGGSTWQAVDLPAIPLEDTDFNYYPGLQILPDASYLSQSPERGDWFWLSPAEMSWCEIKPDNLPNFPMLLQSVAEQLWWVDPEDNEAQHLPLTEISCGES